MMIRGGVALSSRESKINYDKIRKIADSRGSKIHFIGVGGVSMYSLARLSKVLKGCRVSGSDRTESARTMALRDLGCEIFIGHSADNIKNGISDKNAVWSVNTETEYHEKK